MRKVLVALVAGIALGGCVRSVSPVVAEADREFDARLLGNWATSGREKAEVAAKDGDYAVAYTDGKGNVSHFVARLGRMGRYRVLDVSPVDSDLQGNDAYNALLLPVHTFMIVDSIGSEFRSREVKLDSVEAYLARQPTALAHLRVGDEILLTAPTPELRAFLERFAARPGVLEEQGVWTRQ